MDLCKFFDRIVIINLRRRPDRLAAMEAQLERERWPFRTPEVFDAIDGDAVGVPPEFTEGGGAFGCRQSHVNILQRAILDGDQSILILEDDALLLPDFTENVAKFLADVPDDWQGLMLGGQHHTPPTQVTPEIVRVNYAQRTHAYAARPEYMKALVSRWANSTVHIDWRMQDWQDRYRVYAPARWLVAQGRGQSDICGRVKPAESWNDPTGHEPVIVVRGPKAVADELRQWGCHGGYNRLPDGIDTGLAECFAFPNPDYRVTKLRGWLAMIQAEVISEPGAVAMVWHPEATVATVRRATSGEVHEINADTIEAAVAQLPPGLGLKRRDAGPAGRAIVLLTATRPVVDELRRHGFHGGYWRDGDGRDHGLNDIFSQATGQEKTRRLTAWVTELRREAETIEGGVVTVWHPSCTAADLRAATDLKVIEVKAATADEAIRQLAEAEGR